MSYFKDLFLRLCDTKDSRFILDVFTDWIERFAESIHVNSIVFFIAGAVVALCVALFGLKLFKPLVALAFGTAGSMVGARLFVQCNDHFNWMFSHLTQAVLGSVCGLLLAIVVMFLSFKALRLMFSVLMAGTGFLTALYLVNDNYIFAAAIALAAFLLAILLPRILCVLLTSVVGTALAFHLLSAAFPNVTYLAWNKEKPAFAIAIGVALLCIIIQFLSNRRKKKKAATVVEEQPTAVQEEEKAPVEKQPVNAVVWERKVGYVIPFEFD